VNTPMKDFLEGLQLLSVTRLKLCVSHPVILSVTLRLVLKTSINSVFTENIRSQQLKETVIRQSPQDN